MNNWTGTMKGMKQMIGIITLMRYTVVHCKWILVLFASVSNEGSGESDSPVPSLLAYTRHRCKLRLGPNFKALASLHT